MWTCALKVHVDGWEEFEIYEWLVRKKACVDGSMIEGYMVYQNMLYIVEYLPNLALKLNLSRICDPNSNNNFEGEYLKGKGRSRKVKGNYYQVDVN